MSIHQGLEEGRYRVSVPGDGRFYAPCTSYHTTPPTTTRDVWMLLTRDICFLRSQLWCL